MNVVEQLVRNIAIQSDELASLEKQLKDIQHQCTHEYKEEQTYRVCQKCQYVESFHY